MAKKEFYYRWEWQLKSSPAQLWPLVADTNRFDYDTGLPAYDEPEKSSTDGLTNTRRRLRVKLYGLPLEWVEEPFEWTRPFRFGVIRNYKPGPIPLLQPLQQLRIQAQLNPQPDGGTQLIYEVWATPRNWLGHLVIPVQIGQIYARRFDQTFRAYDEMAAQQQTFLDVAAKPRPLASGADRRLDAIRTTLIDEQICSTALVEELIDTVRCGDDLTLNQLRPYALADQWGAPRREVLELMLHATRVGLLDFQWDLLCPMCRVAKGTTDHLSGVTQQVHCDTCNIDYQANFEQSVELTFRPNPAIRQVPQQVAFCTSGPEATPHIAAQQLLQPGGSRTIRPLLEMGRYRLRTPNLPGGQFFRVRPEGNTETAVRATDAGWPATEHTLNLTPTIHLHNDTDDEQLLILEHVTWSDHAVTAAEVTTLQQFRDLFAEEALRPGDQISVGSLTILFTDLRDSTRMYREIGDARAFGLVMDHFDVLREAIRSENGAIVKTIGDAVMAVFLRPVAALRAVQTAQERLSEITGVHPLYLKASVHHGPSIAVTLNERLDYFGSTVNIAARLEKFSEGTDVVISDKVYADPEVRDFLQETASHLIAEPFESTLKGFDDECFTLYRVRIESDNPAEETTAVS